MYTVPSRHQSSRSSATICRIIRLALLAEPHTSKLKILAQVPQVQLIFSAQCGQIRVRYADDDEKDFDLNYEKDANILRSLVVDEALVPTNNLSCTGLQLP